MPFPLREDFLDDISTKHWPIWCGWAQWLALTEAVCTKSSLGIEGFWKREHEILCVQRNRAHWLSLDGESRDVIPQDVRNSYLFCLSDQTFCLAWLHADELSWADGDLWTRMSEREIQEVTMSLNLACFSSSHFWDVLCFSLPFVEKTQPKKIKDQVMVFRVLQQSFNLIAQTTLFCCFLGGMSSFANFSLANYLDSRIQNIHMFPTILYV